MIKKSKILMFLLFLISFGFAQKVKYQPAAWKLLSLSGEVSLNSQYNESNTDNLEISNFSYGGGLLINSSSYIWHPNFLTLNVSGTYTPQLGEHQNFLLPEYFSNFNSQILNISTQFLRTLKYNVNTFYNYNKSNVSNDNLFKQELENTKWGGAFNYNGNYDMSVYFEQNTTNSFEEIFNRKILFNNMMVKGIIKKSFFGFDQNEINYQFTNFKTEQFEVYKFENNNNSASLNNTINFDENKKHSLNSSFFYNNISGNFNLASYGLYEILNTRILSNLVLRNNFGYTKRKRNLEKINELRFKSSLNHSIYQSINNSFSLVYDDRNNIGNFKFNTFGYNFSTNYSKKIPFIKGRLNLNYNYNNLDQTNKSDNNTLSVFEESYLIEDGTITLLRNSNIIIESLIVKDNTGTLIYEENIDYILIERGSNIEIQRLIGGGIPNSSTVLIDYIITQNRSYDYNEKIKSFQASLSFLNELVNLNYLNSSRDVTADQEISFLNLNELNNFRYGVDFNYKFFRTRVTYEEMESTINPYKLWTYQLSANGVLTKKIKVSINGRINDYIMFFEEGRKQKNINISSNIAYNFNYRTKINFYFNYLKQENDFQYINLFNGRTELVTRIKQLFLTLGLNFYNRKQFNSNTDFIGANIKLTRTF